MIELPQNRTYTSKTFDNGDGTFTLRAHAGHIHYKDPSGNLSGVDFTIEDMGAYWRMNKASYHLYVAKDFGAPQLIRFDNRYEGANHSIFFEPHSVWFVNANNRNQRTQIAAAQAVTGVLTGNVIRYTDAFGPGIHFEVTLMRSGFAKEVVFDSQASLGVPPYANYFVVPVAKYMGSGLTVKGDTLVDWDGNSYYEHDARFEIREVATGLKSYIAHAVGQDATGRQVALRVFFEKRGGALWQGKLITQAMVENATYPVRADTVDQFYAGAGDGHCAHWNPSSTWAATHDAAASSGSNYTHTTSMQVDAYNSGSDYQISRLFLPFDTSSLPDAAVISAATLYVYAWSTANGDNDGDDWITVVQTFQASNTSLVVGDYEDCGSDNGNPARALFTPVEGIDTGARVDITGISTAAYTTFALNSTGLGWIDVAGYTKLGIREGHDVIDSAVTGDNQVRFRPSEYTGTTNDPRLDVTYTVPAGLKAGSLSLMGVGI